MSSLVLVVEDQEDVGQLLVRLLRALGHRAAHVADGAAAMHYLRADPAAAGLVILDVMMPGMDGFDVLRAVRAEPATAALPVVMYSALNDPESKRRAAELGAQAYLVKGLVGLEDIGAIVRQYTKAA